MNDDIPLHVGQVEKVSQGAQDYQVPSGGQGNDVPVIPPEIINGDIRETLLTLARALTTHVNMCIAPRVNVVERTMTTRLRDFVRINPPIIIERGFPCVVHSMY